MRLSSSGYLGVGTTGPSNKLHIDYSVNASVANLDEVDQVSAVRFGPFQQILIQIYILAVQAEQDPCCKPEIVVQPALQKIYF